MKINTEKFGICVVCGDDKKGKSEIVAHIKKYNLSKDTAETDKILMLENPENNLHPAEQTVYAEMYVEILKERNGKMLLITNSFHYLEAFVFFIEKHGIRQSARFYTIHNGEISESSEPYDAMASLSQPSFDLTDMKFEFETKGGDAE